MIDTTHEYRLVIDPERLAKVFEEQDKVYALYAELGLFGFKKAVNNG